MINCSIRFALAALAIALLTASPALALQASDNAGNAPYANGWDAGDNGGTGFGPWVFPPDFNDVPSMDPIYGGDPTFIDGVGLGPLAANTLGAPAFGISVGSLPYFFNTVEAHRTFSAPLTVGNTFSVDIDGSALTPAAPFDGKGNVFALMGSDAVERFGMFTFLGSNANNWIATGGNTPVPAADSFHLAFTLTGVDSYSMELTPVGGGAPLYSESGSLGGTAGVGISSIRISNFGTGSSADGRTELFVDNLSVVPEPSTLAMMLLFGLGLVATNRRGAR